MKDNHESSSMGLLVVVSAVLFISCNPTSTPPQVASEESITPIVLYSHQSNKSIFQIILNHNKQNSFIVDLFREDGLKIIVNTTDEKMLQNCSHINNN